MRILGPDGQPIQSGPPVSDNVRQIVDQAKQIAAQGDLSTALQQMVAAFQEDVSSDLVLDTTCELLEQMMRAAGAEQSEELQLFLHLRANRTDPAIYYQVGNRFFQLQQSIIAIPFLRKAKELAGSAPGELGQHIDVDTAQVLLDLGQYEEAITTFHSLNDTYGGLPIWLLLEMAECYALLRQLDEAEAVYDIAPEAAAEQFREHGMVEVREEVGDLIARVHDFDEHEEMDLRAWHYVQTRGMLVETNPDENVPGERFVVFQPSEEDVAFIIGTTAAVLDERGYAPNRILWLGESSEQVARLFAQWWEIDEENIRPYQAGDNSEDEDELGLLVMAHSYDIFALEDEQQFVDLAMAKAGLITFALDLHWSDRQPMAPDIAGFMSQICSLPWEQRMVVSEDGHNVNMVIDQREPRKAAADIAEKFPEDSECDEAARQLLEYYSVCTDLILDHRDSTLMRRPVVAHSPVKSPRVGIG
jgi:tetratricopeptide (TPR) repeat protein